MVALSVVSNVYLSCVPSVASVSGLPILGCPVGCLWITHSWLPCRLSLDYPFVVALSVVSNVYLSCVPSVTSVSGLPILGRPVGCLWITHSWLPCRLSLDYPFVVALSVVSNVYLSCVPSVASVSGLPILGCPVGCLWITHSWLPCRLSLTFIYLVYPVLPVSLDYPFLVALSVVSNVYLSCVPSVTSVSGLPILGCPVGCL